ncbi:alpha-N-arabinofuranosidase [Catellatospora bangladeshensis]|uniref:non-reducing end alpha-L-arabinofuranosidase n=1 Tax=Catellatospora bangladeshensis TaxID=310355 RepID=A0A8J3NIP9_9ACTN|nr:alpha-L-arabinofuranosidase C-terminal domain-containing protein [Catellatospora bangladeshensis]GIF82660.1 intracellular exo-alpha-L-arabinofuranosidase 2 [Catellatospora bangladeshensis]
MITIAEGARTHRIDRRIYGQFAEHLGRCVYEGLWVGEDSPIANRHGIRSDVVAALRAIKVPLVRWPGGCFADEYHWQRGIGPEAERSTSINTHWGGVVETNAFGTHEYFELLHQLDAEAYISGNVGSGTVAEMRDWVEYITLDGTSPMADLRKRHGREQPWRLPFFGVGNESWGCGGHMTPLHYANHYRQYQTYVRRYGELPIYKIACGPNDDDYEWTEVLMSTAARFMDGLSLHYYTLPSGNWDAKGSATDFGDDEWHATIARTRKMATLLERHSAIMDKHDPDKRVGLIVDEWGTWYDPTPGTNPGFLEQQNTIRDAVVAALNFNMFHRHAGRVRMTNIAQMVNVLQAMLLTDGPRLVRTPTYWAFDLYTDHHDAWFVDARPAPGDAPGRIGTHGEYTVSWRDDAYTISVTNAGLDGDVKADVELPQRVTTVHRARILSADSATSHNTFDAPDTVRPVDLDGYQIEGSRLRFTVPARSIVTVRVG